MTVADALKKWTDACSCAKAKDLFVRDGNWTTLKRALRHCREGSEIEEAGKLNGDMVLIVTPAKAEGDPPPGKSHIELPPFHLVVK